MRFNRRRMLQYLYGTGLLTAAYHPMMASGLFRMPGAVAQEMPQWGPTTGQGKSVAVVGAGIAGLTAAYELAKSGFGVTVYEAADHYGGRSVTVRPSDEGYKNWFLNTNPLVTESTYIDTIPAETRGAMVGAQTSRFVPYELGDGSYFETWLNAGPGRIPTHHTGILHYCREFDVPMEPYIFVSDANLMQADGINNGDPMQIREYLYNMNGYMAEMMYAVEEARRGDGVLEARAIDQFQAFLTKFGDLQGDGSFTGTDRAGFVREQGAGTNSGIRNDPVPMERILDAKDLWGGMLNSNQYYWQASLLQPAGGMDMIWHAFLQQEVDGTKIQDLVKLNSPVTAVDYDDTGRLIVTADGPDGADVERFDYAIMTGIPYYTAKIRDNGIFDAGITRHLNSILYENGGKFGWQGRTRFWEEQDTQIFGGISWTNHQIEQIWYPSEGYNGPTGILTGGYLHDIYPMGYPGGQDTGVYYLPDNDYQIPVDQENIAPALRNAGRWGQMDQAERRAQALIGGEALHPGFTDDVYADRGMSVSWQNQPYQRGIAAEDVPGNRPDAYNRLIYPVDRNRRVFMAGDWLSYWSGWQEGSVRSVWWALDQLNMRMGAE